MSDSTKRVAGDESGQSGESTGAESGARLTLRSERVLSMRRKTGIRTGMSTAIATSGPDCGGFSNTRCNCVG